MKHAILMQYDGAGSRYIWVSRVSEKEALKYNGLIIGKTFFYKAVIASDPTGDVNDMVLRIHPVYQTGDLVYDSINKVFVPAK